MEPQIQYAKTSDRVSIAYCVQGDGPPMIYMPFVPVFSHIQMEWQMPEVRVWYEALAERTKLVRYDCRGMGLSDRNVAEFSPEALVKDLEAIIGELGFDKVALFGQPTTGAAAIMYAAKNPELVSHLILWSSVAGGARGPTGSVRSTRVLADKDWKLFTETWAHAAFGWASGDQARRFAELRRESTSADNTQAMWNAFDQIDVTDLLTQIRVPTLVMHRRANPHESLEGVTSLAAGIRDARLVLFEGGEGVPFQGDVEAVLQAITEFLGLKAPAASSQPVEASLHASTAIILFLDIADSTAITTKLGDAAYRAKERELDAALRGAITDAGGTPVEGKVLGDGVMAVFTSARQAIEAAQRCRDLGDEAGLPLHLGIHAGDVVREGNNVHGGAVQLAARVQGAAAPGEILVSATVRDLARTSAGVEFEDRGEHELKGIAEPQRLFAVQEQQ